MKFADLHIHTIFSDGTYTPEGLVKDSLRSGLSTIAVVDHDTVMGIKPTIEIAKENGVEVLSGIELSAEEDGLEVHILGYLIDYERQDLKEKLEFLRKNRIERIYKIVDKLKGIGLSLKAESVFDISQQGTVGRLHVARAMLKAGLVNSTGEAFQKYIGDRSPAYVCNFKFPTQEVIKLIKDIGGIPVLAHPYTLSKDELILKLIDYGLMGLEVYYPEHSQSMVNFYLGLTKKYNLLATGGSDCHGNAKPEAKIGCIKIPYELVEKLKEAQQIN
ncbi:MAG: PHP domain-containing protein [Candidatus Omnitrophota bacterium]